MGLWLPLCHPKHAYRSHGGVVNLSLFPFAVLHLFQGNIFISAFKCEWVWVIILTFPVWVSGVEDLHILPIVFTWGWRCSKSGHKYYPDSKMVMPKLSTVHTILMWDLELTPAMAVLLRVFFSCHADLFTCVLLSPWCIRPQLVPGLAERTLKQRGGCNAQVLAAGGLQGWPLWEQNRGCSTSYTVPAGFSPGHSSAPQSQ